MNNYIHIRKRSEYLQLQKISKKVSNRYFILSYSKCLLGTSDIRLGIIATKKIGNAVVRNRGKRLIREAFRRNKSAFQKGLDVVVICNNGIHKASQSEIDKEMILAARRIK